MFKADAASTFLIAYFNLLCVAHDRKRSTNKNSSWRQASVSILGKVIFIYVAFWIVLDPFIAPVLYTIIFFTVSPLFPPICTFHVPSIFPPIFLTIALLIYVQRIICIFLTCGLAGGFKKILIEFGVIIFSVLLVSVILCNVSTISSFVEYLLNSGAIRELLA